MVVIVTAMFLVYALLTGAVLTMQHRRITDLSGRIDTDQAKAYRLP